MGRLGSNYHNVVINDGCKCDCSEACGDDKQPTDGAEFIPDWTDKTEAEIFLEHKVDELTEIVAFFYDTLETIAYLPPRSHPELSSLIAKLATEEVEWSS